MEGLIPVVLRSLKRNKIRRRYECLSSSGGAKPYATKEFDFDGDNDDNDVSGARYRRWCSVRDGGGGRGFGAMDHVEGYKPKQLVRFRSHRVLSCLSSY